MSEEHYDQVKPSEFAGSATWHTMYTYVSKYVDTPTNRKLYKRWLELMLMLFPCESCSEHAMAQYRKHNIDNYLQDANRLYLYISGVLQEGANDHKRLPEDERPNYYARKRFIFESMTGKCEACSMK